MSTKVFCSSCGSQVKAGRFCEHCGAPLAENGATVQTQASQLPLYTIPVGCTEEAAKSLGEASKVALFGLTSKRPLFGKKPEEYIVHKNTARNEKIYVRIHGVYSAEYTVSKTFSLDVGQDAVKVEVAGVDGFAPKAGAVEVAAKIRKAYRNEAVVVFNEKADEVNIQLPNPNTLEPCRTIPQALNNSDIKRLLDTTLTLAQKVLEFRIQKAPSTIGKIETENLDLSDNQIVLSPYYVLTYENTKTGETKTLTIDAVKGTLQ